MKTPATIHPTERPVMQPITMTYAPCGGDVIYDPTQRTTAEIIAIHEGEMVYYQERTHGWRVRCALDDFLAICARNGATYRRLDDVEYPLHVVNVQATGKAGK